MKEEVKLTKVLDKFGEIKWIAPHIAANPSRMKSLEFTIFPVIEKPEEKPKQEPELQGEAQTDEPTKRKYTKKQD